MNSKSIRYISLIILFSCGGGEKTTAPPKERNVILKYYANGGLKTEVPVEFNRKNGLAKSYYENGDLRQSIQYMNGRKHGEAHTYYENGKPYMISRYKYDQLHGVRERYHPNGQLMSEAPFYEDKPTAGLKEYLLDGSPRKYYPLIIIEDQGTVKKGILDVRVRMSDGSKRVKFYLGELDEDGFIPADASELYVNPHGEASVSFEIPRGASSQQMITILAEVITLQGNIYIVSHTHAVTSLGA